VTKIADHVNPAYDIEMKYDGLSRLLTAKGYWGDGTISYDDMGNIKTKTMGSESLSYFYSTANRRLTSIIGTSKNYSFGYDSMENVTSNGTRSYTYDNGGHLLSSGTMSFLYDGNNLRVVSMKNGAVKEYSMYGNSGKLMFKHDVENGKTTNYIYLNKYLVAKKTIKP
jgi:hypothetical protein